MWWHVLDMSVHDEQQERLHAPFNCRKATEQIIKIFSAAVHQRDAATVERFVKPECFRALVTGGRGTKHTVVQYLVESGESRVPTAECCYLLVLRPRKLLICRFRPVDVSVRNLCAQCQLFNRHPPHASLFIHTHRHHVLQHRYPCGFRCMSNE